MCLRPKVIWGIRSYFLSKLLCEQITYQTEAEEEYLNETYSIQAGSKGPLVWNYNTEHGQQLLERTYNKKYFGIKN